MIRWIRNLNSTLVGSGISKVYVTRPGLIGASATAVVLAVLLFAAFFPTGVYHLRTAAYSAVLPSAGGLSAGDPVYVAGLPAGRVETIRIDGDEVVADFRLDRTHELGERTEAEVKLRTVLGAYYLDVRPRGTQELVDGVIPIERTAVPFSFDEIARAAYDATRTDDPDRETIDYQQLEELADLAYQSVPDRELANEAVSALADAAGIINRNDEQITDLLETGRELAEIVDSQQLTLERLFDQGAVVFGMLGARAELLSGLIQDLETVSARMSELLADEPGEWDRLLLGLSDVTQMLAAESDSVQRSIAELAPAFRTLVDASGSGPWLDVNAPAAILPDNMLCLLGVMEGCQ